MKIFDFPLAFYPPRATLIASEKSIRYDRVILNLFTADNMKPEFLRISLAGTLPCLVDGDTTLTNSRHIVEFLDAKDGKLLGGTEVDRSAVSGWMDKVDAWDGNLFAFANANASVKSILDAAACYKEKAINNYAAKNPDLKEVYDERLAAMKASSAQASNPEEVAKNKSQLNDILQQAEEQLSKQPFLGGSEYTAADVLFTPILYRIHDLSKQAEYLADKPSVREYYKKVQGRPSFKEAYGPAGNGFTLLQLVGGGMARILLAKVTGL